ncbi:MAG TPA: CocE/NonD family hydrolase [Candidatus Sulfotelmatobacter sp.]|nr:CocE/NonD family hydrolase [Candidatus Sulfotelmatobacter sp.]
MKTFQLLLAASLILAVAIYSRADAYDPLAVDPTFSATYVDMTVHDSSRDRDIPVRIYLPAQTHPEPVILFSHGLGGSRAGNVFMGERWAARGYVAVFVQHPGSDESVWQNVPVSQRMQALKNAASLDNFVLRVQDIPAVLDWLEIWNRDNTNVLFGRLNMKEIGMSGHSFGAITTQAVSGESLPFTGKEFTDPRIKAAIAFSPSPPHAGDPAKAFGSVNIPWMLMTGTEDVAPIGDMDVQSRLKVYPALHGAPKYQVVLFGAEHSAFTDRALPGDREPRNPNHHRVILALSTAFWDAYLRGDTNALNWLNGPGPRSVMEPKDEWEHSEH